MDCINCGTAPTMSPAEELCGSCRVTVEREAQSGLNEFSRYLESLDVFRALEEPED